jgi:probable HAF family extracellular repeat protein
MDAFANGINDAGDVAGESRTSTGLIHAFLYRNSQMMDLGTLGGTRSTGFAINNSGQVVGFSQTSSGDTHPFLYSEGQMIDLGTLGGNQSAAIGINDVGQVVGYSGTSGAFDTRAFLYSNGQMMDLNELIDPALGVMLTGADAINDRGQIVATSYTVAPTGITNRAFLLTPIPEPPTWALLGLPLLALLVQSRRQTKVSELENMSAITSELRRDPESETIEGVKNAREIASIPGVTASFAASGDLGNFSGYRQGTPDYERRINAVHDAALAAGKRLCDPFSWRDRPDFTCFQMPAKRRRSRAELPPKPDRSRTLRRCAPWDPTPRRSNRLALN